MPLPNFLEETEEKILARMLARIPDDIDKSEGSYIWDALSPAALELAQAYIDLGLAYRQTFAGDATGDSLDKRAAEISINRIPASPAIGTVKFTGAEESIIPAGSVVATENGVEYETDDEVVIDDTGTATVRVTAVEAGTGGNVPANTITVISTPIPGVASVTNPEPSYGGEDEEADEDFRKRYFDEISNKATDGNIAQYQKWAREYPGIGRAKVFPLWNGDNTVKVSILDAENRVASAGLITDFQEHMDPGSEGLGNGVAPIGSKVTVTTATAVNINVSADLVLAAGYDDENEVYEALTAYFSELAFVKSTVTYIGVGATILNVPAIDQVQNLLINGGVTDIALTSEQIPLLGTTSWTVIKP